MNIQRAGPFLIVPEGYELIRDSFPACLHPDIEIPSSRTYLNPLHPSCEYCGTMVMGVRCESCGAPRKAVKRTCNPCY